MATARTPSPDAAVPAGAPTPGMASVGTSRRTVRSEATRERIVEAALGLFLESGYAPTTIDHIAARAEVGRRTFFRYFPSKEAVLFADLRSRQEWAVARLEDRPVGEPPLTSLIAVFGELCDRPLNVARRHQVRRIVARQPDLLGVQRRVAVSDFEQKLVVVLLARLGDTLGEEQVRVLTSTALACVESAWRVQMTSGGGTLRSHFDLMVEACVVHWGSLGGPMGTADPA